MNTSNVLTVKQATKLANRTSKDYFGTKHPFKGYLGSPAELPGLPAGFKVIYVNTWGYVVINESVNNGEKIFTS